VIREEARIYTEAWIKRRAARPGSRSQSRLGPEASFDEDPETTPIGVARTNDNSHGFGVNPRVRPISGQGDDIQRLKAKLEERDKQLKEQASSLVEMESSFAELQSLLPSKAHEAVNLATV
jgi:hypothetical protein